MTNHGPKEHTDRGYGRCNPNRRPLVSAAALAVLLIALAACTAVDTTPPRITSSMPADGATSVPTSTLLVITFGEVMEQATTEAAVSTDPSIDCAFSWSKGGTELICDPATDLSYATLYSITVGTGALDAAGNALASDFVVAFTTEDAPAPGSTIWLRQFGSDLDDFGDDIAVDGAGNIVVVGSTSGSFAGTPSGSSDAFVQKHDETGNVLWARQFGTDASDGATRVAVSTTGMIVVVGQTAGSLEGPSEGGTDAFVRAYDPDGGFLWAHQFGTEATDIAFGIAIDGSDNVYVAGFTGGSLEGINAGSFDGFFRKYDSSGTELWTKQFGTPASDRVFDLAVDASGRALAVGSTLGELDGTSSGGADAFVIAVEADGTTAWTRQFGTPESDSVGAVAIGPFGDIYAAGATQGSLGATNAGGEDMVVRRFDSDGNAVWTRQIGTSERDDARGLTVDAGGNLLLTGFTLGTIGDASAGESDVIVRKYDPFGGVVWTQQVGSASFEDGQAIVTDASGEVIVTGYTMGSWGGDLAGGTDLFVLRLVP